MEPINNSNGKWEIFLHTVAEEVRLGQNVTEDVLSRTVNHLTTIEKKADAITEVIKKSGTARLNFENIIYAARIRTVYTQPPHSTYSEKISILYESIMNHMNFPCQYPFMNSLKKEETHSLQKPCSQLFANMLNLGDAISTNPNPRVEEIDQVLLEFDNLLWKSLTILKNTPYSKSFVEITTDFLKIFTELTKKDDKFYTENALKFIETLLTHTQIAVNSNLILRLLQIKSSETIGKTFLVQLKSFGLSFILEENTQVLKLIKLRLPLIVALIKNNPDYAVGLKLILEHLFKQYREMTFTRQDGNNLIQLFDLIDQLHQQVPGLLNEEMITAFNDTICIQFDEGPLYVKKYRLLVISKSSEMIHQLLFGYMKEAVEFTIQSTLTIKEIRRKDFRLMLLKYYSCQENTKKLTLKEILKLTVLGDFFDIKSIREDTKKHLQEYLVNFPKNDNGIFTDDSFKEIYDLIKVLHELNLLSAIEACIEVLKLPTLIVGQPLFNKLIGEAKSLCPIDHYFRQYCLYYSLIKKFFPERLKEIHKQEVSPLIQSIVNISLTDICKFSAILSFLADAITTQPYEKTCEFEESTEFGDFVLVENKHSGICIDLDLSQFPVQFQILEAMRGIYIGTLLLQKSNFSEKDLRKITKLFPAVIINFKE